MSGIFRMPCRHPRGFTLVELMVVVAVIAILSAVAVPSYRRYGLRARRADAHQALWNAAMAQERYYAAHNRYGSLTEIGFKKDTSEKGYYRLRSSGDAKGTYFQVTAIPVPGGPQAKDNCTAMAINDLGQKSFEGNATNGSCLW